MIQVTEKSKCTGCHACVNACPKNCISMTTDNEGFLYPEIRQTECVNCGKCEKVCPLLNGKTKNPDALQIGYAAYNKDETIRLKSSSGGIFTLLAEWIIQQGGVVVGATMTEDCKSVQHTIAETIEDLENLRGSKYLQSIVGMIFKSVKKYLDSGRLVLFTGTPCQVSGLYSYLGKKYDNLYTQDLICHGVPSPLIWKNYVELRERKSGASARRTFFRHKKYGWKRYSMLFEFSNNIEYLKYMGDDPYMKGFLQNIYLRSSCYHCAFKTTERQADITLADFWGIQKVLPEIDDDKGASFVWIHSLKGKQLFESLKKELDMLEIECDTALKYNPSAVKTVSPHPKSDYFWKNYNGTNLEELIKICCKPSVYQRIIKILSKTKHFLLDKK